MISSPEWSTGLHCNTNVYRVSSGEVPIRMCRQKCKFVFLKQKFYITWIQIFINDLIICNITVTVSFLWLFKMTNWQTKFRQESFGFLFYWYLQICTTLYGGIQSKRSISFDGGCCDHNYCNKHDPDVSTLSPITGFVLFIFYI